MLTVASSHSENSWNRRPSPLSGLSRILEIGAIFMVLSCLTHSPPPDVNEAHYLTKAKHFWNSEYCPHDLFLNSASAHWLFYLTFGWLSLFMSLDNLAWTGRALVNLLMAAGWQNLSWNILPRKGFSLFTLIVFFFLNHSFHLAGEWVIGGFEAKGLAYGLLFFGLSAAISNSWSLSWIFLGAATAFHPLVGGWTWLALTVVRIGAGPVECNQASTGRGTGTSDRHWEKFAFLAALGISLPGLLPPLLADRGIDDLTRTSAHQIHVMQRLPHHLYFLNFTTGRTACFVSMALAWFGLYSIIRRRWRQTYLSKFATLFYFGFFSLMIAWGGLILSAVAEAQSTWSGAAISLLRFYWFRLSDFAIPLSLAFGLVYGSQRLLQHNAHPWGRGLVVLSSIGLLSAFIGLGIERQRDQRPLSDQQSLPLQEDPERTSRNFRNWRNICQWIADSTPSDAIFITPWQQQTFKWYASRSEVVNWKDVPQDARSVVIWFQRVEDLLEPQRRFELGLMSYSDDQLRELASRYNAGYLVVLQKEYRTSGSQLKLVYPEDPREKTGYVVIQF
jgi:hypothetical protein